MYCGIKVSVTPNTIIESIESLSTLLTEVDNYLTCPGATERYYICDFLLSTYLFYLFIFVNFNKCL